MKDNIEKVLNSIKDAKSLMEINDMLNLKTVEEYQELEKSMNELVDEFVVYKTNKDKYMLFKNNKNLRVGNIQINKKGFGFVLLDKEEDLYVDKINLNGAIAKDFVLAEIIDKNAWGARIVKVLKRNLNNIVGTVYGKNNKWYIKPNDDSLNIIVEIDKHSSVVVVEGNIVLGRLSKKINNEVYIASVTKIIGHKDDPGVDILAIAYKYEIYEEFGNKVEEELKNIPDSVDEKELNGRIDLTNECIFTIDGDDTKDIDDAINVKYENNTYTLGVHIADVSNYVKENTALGDAAFNRGTSNYLANTVIPMLPHQLSNGICSLNENVIRLTLSCVMKFDENGNQLEYDIFPSYIKSRKKMTYKKVNDIIVRNIIDPEYEEYVDDLKTMNDLAKILRKRKISRGYIEFDIDEAKIIQDDKGIAVDIVKRTREDGENLIEDFMIAANECVATHIYNMDLPFIYRVHDYPNSEKITDFTNLVKLLGYTITSNITELTPLNVQAVLNELKDKKEFKILSTMLLRSMKKAEYSKENIGHFGLASNNYTHFTSPIRRFPDLTVHRLLKKYLVDKDFSMETINSYNASLEEIAKHSSEREVAAIEAEREVADMKMAEYMESHIGEIYTGMISTVTNFGFFVELPNLIEGLVHVNNLKGDYYAYDRNILAMVGKSTKKKYQIGDEITIKVLNANKDTAMIDFIPVSGEDYGNKE